MNVPYNGEFPIKAVFNLDQLPIDKTQDGSRWLPALSDAQEYWQKSGQLVQMSIANSPLKKVPYFPTEKVKGEYDKVIKQQLGLAGAVTGIVNDLLNTNIKPIVPNCDFPANVNLRVGNNACMGLYPFLYPYADNSGKQTEPLDVTLNTTIAPVGLIDDTGFNTINDGLNNFNVGYKLNFIQGNPPPMNKLADGTETPARIIPNSGTPQSVNMTFTQTIKEPIFPPEPIPEEPYLKFYEDILFPIPNLGISCGAIYNYSFQIEVSTWNENTLTYDVEIVDYSCSLFFTSKVYFLSYDYLIKNNYFSENKLNENLITSGSTNTPLARNYLSVIQSMGFGAFKGAFAFGGAGLGVVIEAQDSTVLSELYFAIPIYASDVNNNIRKLIKDNYDLYPMAYDIKKDLLINLPRMNMEAVSTLLADDELIYLDETENYSDFNYFGANDGAYTVIAGGMQYSDNSSMMDEIIFLLRNGKGWYNLKLNDLLTEQETVDYFSYEYGIIYLGINGINPDDPIKYLAVIPNLPFQRVPLLTYDFKKLGISFIPCQTHCMAKGGIVSKVH